MPDIFKLPLLARNPMAWSLTLLLALLAWIATLQQTLSMLPMQMYGTMGMPFGPFLFFWTVMMAAMMLPALAPTTSVRFELLQQQSSSTIVSMTRISAFIAGYLVMWCLFGIPIFWLSLLSQQLVQHEPFVSLGLGIMLFLAVGFYQLTPLKKSYLTHCNPGLCCHTAMSTSLSVGSMFGDIKEGLRHSLSCLGCCGGLMLILVAVGLMNLTWMILVTVLIFLEKAWHQGHRLSFFVGMALIFYGILAAADPSLLPGLYIG
jgi:predicted metal-binding membrane protein